MIADVCLYHLHRYKTSIVALGPCPRMQYPSPYVQARQRHSVLPSTVTVYQYDVKFVIVFFLPTHFFRVSKYCSICSHQPSVSRLQLTACSLLHQRKPRYGFELAIKSSESGARVGREDPLTSWKPGATCGNMC